VLGACASQSGQRHGPSSEGRGERTVSLTVLVHGLRSDEGRVTGSLCDDPAAGYCSTYVARTTGSGGKARLRFEGVAPGRYLLSTVHDVNEDGRTQAPPDGAAFGNNSTMPIFEAASILVD